MTRPFTTTSDGGRVYDVDGALVCTAALRAVEGRDGDLTDLGLELFNDVSTPGFVAFIDELLDVAAAESLTTRAEVLARVGLRLSRRHRIKYVGNIEGTDDG